MKVVLFNGPPGSGKDSAGEALATSFKGAFVYKFAEALKLATHALFGEEDQPAHAFEKRKGTPLDEFFGMTPRATYIKVSETAVKPAFGRDFFGKVLAKQLRRAPSLVEIAAITDSGFDYEAAPVIEAAGRQNVLLIRVHRRGKTFDGDSRSYIEIDNLASRDLWNLGSEQEWHAQVISEVHRWMMTLEQG